MDLTFREETPADAELAADIATAMRPDEPVDPAVERYLWENPSADEILKGWIGALAGSPVAIAQVIRRDWPEDDETRGGYVEVALRPEATNRARLRQLIDFASSALAEAGGRVAEALAREDEPWLREAFLSSGYDEDHLSKIWELDLVSRRQDILAGLDRSRSQLRRLGARCLPLAESTIPDRMRRLHELTELARRDIPRSVPALPNPKEMFVTRMRAPGISEERIWVVELEGELAAYSYLRYPPLRGHVWTGFTASHPGRRGLGLARAAKMETLAQALAAGIPLVRTDNDERNAPMLHINETLGYHPIPAWVSHLKRLV